MFCGVKWRPLTCITHLNNEIRIEVATESDSALILTFLKELADYERLADTVLATEDSLRRSLFEMGAARAIIAYDQQTPVAFAVYFFNFSTFEGRGGLYLEDIFVRPAFRGLGVGRRMFAFLAKTALEVGCSRIELSVLNWNEKAIAFYKSLGGEPLIEWTVFRFQTAELSKLSGAASEPPQTHLKP